MSKNIYYIMVAIWVAWGLILFFQNIVLPSSLYSFMGRKTWAIVLMYCLWFGFLIWYGISWIFHSKKEDNYEDDNF